MLPRNKKLILAKKRNQTLMIQNLHMSVSTHKWIILIQKINMKKMIYKLH